MDSQSSLHLSDINPQTNLAVRLFLISPERSITTRTTTRPDTYSSLHCENYQYNGVTPAEIICGYRWNRSERLLEHCLDFQQLIVQIISHTVEYTFSEIGLLVCPPYVRPCLLNTPSSNTRKSPLKLTFSSGSNGNRNSTQK